jgi:hypothetical protein
MRLPHMILGLSVCLVVMPSTPAQESPEVLPKIIHHIQPIYPPIARIAHVQGDVLIKLTTDGESVTNAEAESGPPMLRKAAEDNVLTWKFVRTTQGTFYVTFRYRIMSGDVDVTFLESPGVVQLLAPVPELNIDYADIGLGKWKAQLKSAHGKSWQMFNLSYSGPKGEWLNGSAISPRGDKEEIDWGQKEGKLLGFTIKLVGPDGQRVKTFLVGNLTGDRIVGTFVDEAGTAGEWTAIRETLGKPKN